MIAKNPIRIGNEGMEVARTPILMINTLNTSIRIKINMPENKKYKEVSSNAFNKYIFILPVIARNTNRHDIRTRKIKFNLIISCPDPNQSKKRCFKNV